jgi:hypothetical protein
MPNRPSLPRASSIIASPTQTTREMLSLMTDNRDARFVGWRRRSSMNAGAGHGK